MVDYVFIQYGFCAGLNPLTGRAQITDTKTRAGLVWVYVEPVSHEDSIPLPKWVPFNSVQYSWEQKAA